VIGRLAPWVAAAAAEWALAAGTAEPPLLGQGLGELLIFGLLGLAQARLAPADWRGSSLWPAILLVAAAGARAPQASVLLLGPLALGVAVVAARVGHDLLGRLPALPVGLMSALLGAVLARAVVLFTNPVALPERELLAELVALGPAPARVEGPGGPPVVVITVDTLRADHMVQMEAYRRLAAQGSAFPRAMSTSSWTVPSLASLWTGRSPAEHGAAGHDRSRFTPIRPDVPHLAEELAARGYATAAFVANPFLAPELGFSRGFARWSNPDQQIAQPLAFLGRRPGPGPLEGSRVVDRAVDWLDGAPRRDFLLWVHLCDCHLPYRHLAEGDPAVVVRSPVAVRTGELPVDSALQAAVKRAYAAEVAYDDAEVMRLLDVLEGRGFFAEGGLLVFTADHGEELWDHGSFEHGHSHHGEVVDVGLVIVGPGLAAGERSEVASLQDVAPTIRSRLGLPGEGLDLGQGVPAGRAATAAGNLYGAQQTSARDGQHKGILTHDESGVALRLYDVVADPGERVEVAPAGQSILPVLRGVALPEEIGEAAILNQEALEALGYVEGKGD
jgi:arylsulfatase A-like enzyme